MAQVDAAAPEWMEGALEEQAARPRLAAAPQLTRAADEAFYFVATKPKLADAPGSRIAL